MSRYFSQLARDARVKVRPPSSLRLAPRAPAYEEVHEERIVPPAQSAGDVQKTAVRPADVQKTAVTPADVARPAEQRLAPQRTPDAAGAPVRPIAKGAESPRPGAPVVPSAAPGVPLNRERRVDHRPFGETRAARWEGRNVSAAVPASSETPQRSKLAEPGAEPTFAAITEEHTLPAYTGNKQPAADQRPAWREVDEQILDVVQAVSVFAERDGSMTDRPRGAGFAVPVPTRRQDRDRPVVGATREPQPVIDVTIGKIEVTIEGESRPPLRAIRSAEPRSAAPRRTVLPPRTGRLARQYLDR